MDGILLLNTGGGEVTITGNGRETNGGKVPKIETTIKFPAGEITATASDNGIQGT